MADVVHQLTVAAPPAWVRESVTTEAGLRSFWTDQVQAEPEVGTTVRWLLSPTPDGTTVRFEHRDWRSVDGELGQCSYVWAPILDRLSPYVADGTADACFRQAG